MNLGPRQENVESILYIISRILDIPVTKDLQEKSVMIISREAAMRNDSTLQKSRTPKRLKLPNLDLSDHS